MKSKAFLFRLFLILTMIVVATVFYNQLPETIPIHWNIQGEPDDFASKTWAAWLMPSIGLICLFLFPLLAKIDPHFKNYKDFSRSFEVIQTLIIVLFAFFFFLQYYMILNPEQSYLTLPLILSAMGISFIVIGNYLGKVRQNFFVGLRTPWTLKDPEVWQKSQRLSGWTFVIGGLIFLLEAWLKFYFGFVFVMVILTIVLVPTLYSYLLYRRKHLE